MPYDSPSEIEAAPAAGVDQARIRAAVREILVAIGEDPDREGLLDTPARVARAYSEIFGGMQEDVAPHLARTFTSTEEGVVLLSNIDFHSVCEHHLLPFMGRAHVAYLPDGNQVVGLSKLARCVDVFARRPQIQEQLGGQIADALMSQLGARGALVHVEAEHLCMKMRGVKKSNALMRTTAVRGEFAEDPYLREAILAQIRASGTGSHSAERLPLPARIPGNGFERSSRGGSEGFFV
jgi:GTP cyclohydrolase IA